MITRLTSWPCRVLLVDENDAFLDGLTDWFEDKDEIEIVGRAHSGPEACQRNSSLKPDLVLIDTGLPGGNGFEILQTIKAEPNPPWILMMSFHDSTHIRSTASSGGADDCITKADIPKNLVPLVETLIKCRETDSIAADAPNNQSRETR